MSKLTFSLTRTSESPGWAPASSAAHTNLWRDAAVAATTATGPLAAGPGGSFTSTGDLTLSEVTFAGGPKVGRPGGSAVSVDWDPTGLRALLSMALVWNTIKNVSVTEFVGERLEIRNWVDVFVALQSAGPLTVVLEAAKRGEVLLTGDGDFTVEIGIDSNSKDWTNAFRIRTDSGDDVVRIRESAINAVSGRYLGQFTDTDIATGAGNDQVFGWGSNDAIDGGEGRDVFVLRGIQAGYRITTDGEWTTIVDIDARDGNDGTDRIRNVEVIKFAVGADLILIPLNRDPIAADDAYVVRAGQVLTVSAGLGVLANDTDADGDALSVARITDTVNNGTLSLLTTGAFSYTPNAGFTGTDQFTYRIRDGLGGFDEATVTITVANAAPLAADDAYATRPGQVLTVSAGLGVLANDTDADGDALSVARITDTVNNGTLSLLTTGAFSYTPNAGFTGTDQFTYRVSDGFGGTDTATVTITVVNAAPDAVADLYTVRPGKTLEVSVAHGLLANDTDADGDPLTVITINDQVDNGVLQAFVDGSFNYTPNAGFTGTDRFTYRVSDGFGGTDTATVTITVVNAAPDAVADLYTARPGQTLEVSTALGVLRNDTDADGDPLTVITVTDTVNNGVLQAFVDGSFNYTPNAGFTGTDRFTYRVSDGFGGTDTATVTITVVNTAPVAVNDSYAMRPGQTLTVPVGQGFLANDTDADGDRLSVAAIIDRPDNGTLTVGRPDGSFVYTPNTGFVGTDSFLYSIRDGFGGFATATVFITVTNAAPVAVDDRYETGPGQTLTVPVAQGFLANDTDADGDRLSVAAIIDRPDNGTLTVGRPDGSFVYTPNTGFVRTDSFLYSIRDGFGGFATATVFIEVTNGNPVFVADAPIVIRPGQQAAFTGAGLIANDTDPNGDALQVTQFFADTAQGGRVDNTAFDTFTYTPRSNFLGNDTFSYVVTDGRGGLANATLTISVVNSDPVAVADPAITMRPGQQAVFTGAGLTANDTDADGDDIIVTQFFADTAQDGSVSNTAFDTFTYTPPANFTGTDTFTYTISDGFGGFSTTTLTINVVNTDPVAVADPAITIRPGQQAVFTGAGLTANDTDADGDDIIVTQFFADTAQGGRVDNTAFDTFTYTPKSGFTGTDTFTYTISDGFGGFSTTTLTIAVRNVPPGLVLDDLPVLALADVEITPLNLGLFIPAPDAIDDAFTVSAGQTLVRDAADGLFANDLGGRDQSVTENDVGRHEIAGKGVLDIFADGAIAFTPQPGFTGEVETFVDVAFDGVPNPDTARLTITVLDPFVCGCLPAFCDQIDFHERAVGKPRHAHGGAGGKAAGREERGPDRVQRGIVAVELRQVDARHHRARKIEPDAAENEGEVAHHRARLCLHAFGQHARRFWAVRHLAGDEHEAASLDRVAERRDRLRPARDHVEDHLVHAAFSNRHQAGVWSDGLSHPRGMRSTPASARRSAAAGLSSSASMRRPLSRGQAPA